jgi:hypothetical protein
VNAPWWGVALAIGLVGGALLWAVQPDPAGGGSDSDGLTSHGLTTTGAQDVPPPLRFPFSAALGDPSQATTFVVLAPRGNVSGVRSAFLAFPDIPTDHYVWQSPYLALATESNNATGCWMDAKAVRVLCPGGMFQDRFLVASAPPTNDTGARLLHEGYNATKVTAYIFDEEGLLLASNANDTARFELHGDFIRLPSAAWYLGDNGTAPPGTTFLPGLAKPLVDKVRPELDGLPVGGVASTRSNAYVNYYGSLFVTVRIDSLVHAP